MLILLLKTLTAQHLGSSSEGVSMTTASGCNAGLVHLFLCGRIWQQRLDRWKIYQISNISVPFLADLHRSVCTKHQCVDNWMCLNLNGVLMSACVHAVKYTFTFTTHTNMPILALCMAQFWILLKRVELVVMQGYCALCLNCTAWINAQNVVCLFLI